MKKDPMVERAAKEYQSILRRGKMKQPKKRKPEIMWFIDAGGVGLYVGGEMTRREAIESICRDFGHGWKTLYRRGLRAVKCEVRIIAAKKRRKG